MNNYQDGEKFEPFKTELRGRLYNRDNQLDYWK